MKSRIIADIADLASKKGSLKTSEVSFSEAKTCI